MIRINVTVGEIVDFNKSLAQTDAYIDLAVDQILRNINEQKDIMNKTINDLNSLSVKAEQIRAKLIEERDYLEGVIAGLELQLANEPKELIEYYHDEDGNLCSKRVPNPRYYALKSEIRSYQIQLATVERKIQHCESIQARIASDSHRLSIALSGVESYELDIRKERTAIRSDISIAMNKIKEYQNLVEKYCEKRFINTMNYIRK